MSGWESVLACCGEAVRASFSSFSSPSSSVVVTVVVALGASGELSIPVSAGCELSALFSFSSWVLGA